MVTTSCLLYYYHNISRRLHQKYFIIITAGIEHTTYSSTVEWPASKRGFFLLATQHKTRTTTSIRSKSTHTSITISMPRFSKPAVENDAGEIIMPGAYQAAPGGRCERRSTLEWDNETRGALLLLRPDDLSGVELSDDDNDDDDDDDDDNDNNNNNNNNNHNHNHMNASCSRADSASTATATASLRTSTTNSTTFTTRRRATTMMTRTSQNTRRQNSTNSGEEDEDEELGLSSSRCATTATTITYSNGSLSLSSSSRNNNLDVEQQEVRGGGGGGEEENEEEAMIAPAVLVVPNDDNNVDEGREAYVPQQPETPVHAYIVGVPTATATEEDNYDNNNKSKYNYYYYYYCNVFRSSRSIKNSSCRTILLLVMGLVTLGFGTIMIVLWQTQGNNGTTTATTTTTTLQKNSFAPPSPDLAYRQELGLQNVIQNIWSNNNTSNSTSKLLPDWSSPYYRALYWLLYQDPLQLTLDQPYTGTNETNNQQQERRIQQRYIMATFYFATSQSSSVVIKNNINNHKDSISSTTWKQCGAPTDINTATQQQEGEKCTHQELVGWNPRTYVAHPNSWRWLSQASECEWAGITCNESDEMIISIDLGDYGLQGKLVEELALIVTSLRVLSLPYNDGLTGLIPTNLLQLVERLDLQYNRFDGPLDLFETATMEGQDEDEALPPQNSNLRILNLAGNNITGTLSPTASSSSSMLGRRYENLRQLFLQDNQLTGTLPETVFSQFSNLDRLRLDRNKLEGRLPRALFTTSTALRELDVSNNRAMTGTIPIEIANLANSLRRLNLANLQLLSGSLPIELYSLTNLVVLDVQNNSFTGTVATDIGSMSKLQDVYLQNNALNGSLPTELGQLIHIQALHLEGNDFVGVVPAEFCGVGGGGLNDTSSTWADHFPLAHTVDVIADCTPEPESDSSSNSTVIATLECPYGCCSSCCQKSSGECTLNAAPVLGYDDNKHVTLLEFEDP